MLSTVLSWMVTYMLIGFSAGVVFIVLGRLVDADEEDTTLLDLANMLLMFTVGWAYIVFKLASLVLTHVIVAIGDWAEKTVVFRGAKSRAATKNNTQPKA